MPQRRDDPYLNFNFRVEIEGLEVAGFSEVQIPEGRIEAVAYRDRLIAQANGESER